MTNTPAHLSPVYLRLWRRCVPLLRQGRPDDLQHAADTVGLVVDYRGPIRIDRQVLIPVAMMHDIGHSSILPVHFQYVTGGKKLVNGKLAHMLAGAKIATDLLEKVSYPRAKRQAIVDLISLHDADQLTGIDLAEAYPDVNAKFFHDIDHLDRYTEGRIQTFTKMHYTREQITTILGKDLKTFFYPEFRRRAKKQLDAILKNV